MATRALRPLTEDGLPAGPELPPAAPRHDPHRHACLISIGGGTDRIQRHIDGDRILGRWEEPQIDEHVPLEDVAEPRSGAR